MIGLSSTSFYSIESWYSVERLPKAYRLSSSTIAPEHVHQHRRRSVLLVSVCTLLAAAAQIFFKIGMQHFEPRLLALVTNLPLIAGYVLYGLFTLGMVVALRDAELSILYPIIALSYVWVTALSYFFFRDTLNPLKLTGIVCIMAGVAVLGRGQKA
jgi:drug/metabolite transporter (DMT)-like permease